MQYTLKMATAVPSPGNGLFQHPARFGCFLQASCPWNIIFDAVEQENKRIRVYFCSSLFRNGTYLLELMLEMGICTGDAEGKIAGR